MSVYNEFVDPRPAAISFAVGKVRKTGYYSDYWRRWRADVEKWDALYAPRLATLAAAQEPISLDQLAAWSGVSAKPYAVKRQIDAHRAAFVKRTDDYYSLYHTSLRDYLTGNRARLQTTDEISDEMRDRTCEAHRRIVEYYRGKCGGEWPKLITDPLMTILAVI